MVLSLITARIRLRLCNTVSAWSSRVRGLEKILVLVGLILIGGCASHGTSDGGVTQVSTLNALIEGAYESNVTIGELTEHGHVGLGTPNHLNGEMIVLDGTAYRVDMTGAVHELDPDTRTPFAVVARMNDPRGLPLDAGTRYDDLKKIVDDRISSPNYIFTIRIDGTFDAITVRSVPRQEPPYRRLTEVIKNQRTFEYSNVEGTLVGFRFPGYMKRLNAEGYHLHFLSDDRTKGGHVLKFTTGDVELSIERERSFEMILPEHDLFSETDLSEHRSREVREVEKQ